MIGDNIGDLASVEFGQLEILLEIHRLGSFSKAAESFGIGQSTASYAIKKLRQAFDDELFVREAGKLVPTLTCERIAETAGAALDDFRRHAQPDNFDPLSATNTATLVCNNYERSILLPAIVRALRREAPGVTLNVRHAGAHGIDLVSSGAADLLIGPAETDSAEMYSRRLCSDHYVCVLDADHDLSRTTLTLEAYLSAAHVIVTYDGEWKPLYLRDVGIPRSALRSAVDLPGPGEIAGIVKKTDLIATIPARLAPTHDPQIKICPSPFETEIAVDLFWTGRTNNDPFFRWLRQLVYRAASSIV